MQIDFQSIAKIRYIIAIAMDFTYKTAFGMNKIHNSLKESFNAKEEKIDKIY